MRGRKLPGWANDVVAVALVAALFLAGGAALAVASPAVAYAGKVERTYHRTWNGADRLYGAEGEPAPAFRLRSAPGYMTTAARRGDDVREVWIGRRARVDLRGANGRAAKRWARTTLLHEWAHVYQDHRKVPSWEAREGGAQLFSHKLGWANGIDDRAQVRAFRAEVGWGRFAWRRAQFGEHWGADPRTITY